MASRAKWRSFGGETRPCVQMEQEWPRKPERRIGRMEELTLAVTFRA